jgi:hypothetical protein
VTEGSGCMPRSRTAHRSPIDIRFDLHGRHSMTEFSGNDKEVSDTLHRARIGLYHREKATTSIR